MIVVLLLYLQLIHNEELNEMIKRNPYYKTTASTKRIKEVKDLLADVGMRLYNDRDSEEFQVYPIGDVRGGKRTYFTLDRSAEGLEDALHTGLDMARRMKKEKIANPRCRTFQVKRKVGKRTIQVKRKVCNPEENSIDLDNLIGKKIELHEIYYPLSGIGRITESSDSNLKTIGILYKGNIRNKYGIKDKFGIIGFDLHDVIQIKNNKIYIEK